MRLFLIFFFGISVISKAQKNDFIQKWSLEKFTRADSSRILDKETLSKHLDLWVINEDSLIFRINGRAQKYKYSLLNNVLVFGTLTFKIVEVNAASLILDDPMEPDPGKALRVKFLPKNLYDLTYTPESYLAKNKDLVYKSFTPKLEPFFIDKNMSPMDFVFERFGFPEYRKGGFVVRFIVTKEGNIKGTKVLASSNDRYNEKLIASVNKTKGKWLPAEYLGKKVNVELEYDFNLGYAEKTYTSLIDSTAYSQSFYEAGNEYFQSGTYKQAEKYYQKAIEYNPLNINAYYQHAAASIALRNKQAACNDYQQLIFLEQKKAQRLRDKYCK